MKWQSTYRTNRFEYIAHGEHVAHVGICGETQTSLFQTSEAWLFEIETIM